MTEQLMINKGLPKEEKYRSFIPQLRSLLQGETDTIANLANVAAALRQTFGFFWVGFYIVKDGELVLGPFQGSVACTRIKLGKGVCGTAWREKRTLVVPDVNQFEGHIACDSASQSEIVLPVFRQDEVIAVLDVDSDLINNFDDIDARYLGEVVSIVEENWRSF